MTTNKSVTIYHYDDDAEVWSIIYTGDANVYLTDGAQPEKGLREDDTGMVRIPTTEDIPVSLDDKIVVGKCTDPAPPRERAHTVLRIGDRRCGTNPHWKFEVE